MKCGLRASSNARFPQTPRSSTSMQSDSSSSPSFFNLFNRLLGIGLAAFTLLFAGALALGGMKALQPKPKEEAKAAAAPAAAAPAPAAPATASAPSPSPAPASAAPAGGRSRRGDLPACTRLCMIGFRARGTVPASARLPASAPSESFVTCQPPIPGRPTAAPRGLRRAALSLRLREVRGGAGHSAGSGTMLLRSSSSPTTAWSGCRRCSRRPGSAAGGPARR
jgi:hypothetical protein